MQKENVVYHIDKSKYNVRFFRNRVQNDEISRAHYHSSTEFNIVLSGELGCIVDGEKFFAGEGQLFCFNAMESHMFIGKKDSVILCVVLSADIIKPFNEQLQSFNKAQKHELPLFLDNVEANKIIIEKFLEWEQVQENCNIFEHSGFVNLIFGNIVRNYGFRAEHQSVDIKRRRDKESLLIRSILDYVDTNYEKNITLDTLADEFGYSRTSISRTIHKVIYQDFRSYLNAVRVEKVYSKLVTNPDRNVMDIAFECGFENMNSFYRAYKKRFGCSPKRKT